MLLLYRFSSLRWYDAISTTAASRSSSTMSRYLITDSVFDCSGISVQSVGIPISVWTIASIPYVSVKGDIPVGLQAVVL